MMYLIVQKILEETPKEIAKAMAKRIAVSTALSMSLEALREGLDYWQQLEPEPELYPESDLEVRKANSEQVTFPQRMGKVIRVGVAQTSGSTVYEVLKKTTKWSNPACMGAGVMTTLFMQKLLDPNAEVAVDDPLKPLPQNEVIGKKETKDGSKTKDSDS